MPSLLEVLAAVLAVGVENLDFAIFSLLVDLLGGLDEGLFDFLGRLGGRLNEVQSVLLRECLSFFTRHLTLGFHITLVTDQDDHNVVAGALAAVLKPGSQVLESFTTISTTIQTNHHHKSHSFHAMHRIIRNQHTNHPLVSIGASIPSKIVTWRFPNVPSDIID